MGAETSTRSVASFKASRRRIGGYFSIFGFGAIEKATFQRRDAETPRTRKKHPSGCCGTVTFICDNRGDEYAPGLLSPSRHLCGWRENLEHTSGIARAGFGHRSAQGQFVS